MSEFDAWDCEPSDATYTTTLRDARAHGFTDAQSQFLAGLEARRPTADNIIRELRFRWRKSIENFWARRQLFIVAMCGIGVGIWIAQLAS